jgi:hypothetical protein
MRIASIVSRRLSINVLLLVVLLTALVYAPPQAAAVPPVWCEEMGCVEWSLETGCTATMFCCVFNDGAAMCWRNGVLVN